jgi:hypothetical protein
MSKQQTFGEKSSPDEAEVYYRPVKVDVRGIPKPDETSIPQAEEVEELLEYIKDEKLKYPTTLEEAEEMGEVAYDSAVDITEDGPDRNTNVKLFLANFCDSLESQQRSPNKYAMLVCYESDFLLAHVKTERGMSLQEESGDVELVHRFLDVDNILSAAYFEELEDDTEDIRFTHFTDTNSGSFRSFLGISAKRVNYRRKSVQINCFYEGKSGLDCKFEFSNDQLEERWLQQGSIEIKNNKLHLSNGRSHNIKEVSWGQTDYEMVEVFMSEFKEYSFDLNGQSRRYDDLKRIPGAGGPSIYGDDIDIIDHKTEVVIEDEDGELDVQPKGELPDHIHVLYANTLIELGADFASDIFRDLVDTADFCLYHPSQSVASNAFTINGLSLLNVDEEDLDPRRADLLATIHDHLDNAAGQTVRRSLGMVFLRILADCECGSVGFENGLKQLINLNSGATRQHDVVTTKENDGDGLIEYKDRDDLGKEDTAACVVENIQKERRNNDKKVFLWGFDEKTRQLDGLRKGRWGDDRVSGVQDHVRERLDEREIDYEVFRMLNFPIGEGGENCIIAGIIY